MLDDSLVRAIVGPYGSGKSMAALMELFRRMVSQAPDADNVRPTRFVIVRNTAAQLRESVLKDATEYFGPYFTHVGYHSKMVFDFNLGDGTRVESEWLLIPLERPEDRRRLLSLNITGALIEECREIPFEVVSDVLGRCGRYPSQTRVHPSWHGVLLVSNPWSVTSDYHRALVTEVADGWKLFRQPSGLSPEAENLEHLPAGYYQTLALGGNEQWIKVHVHGEWGDDLGGQAVYQGAFSADLHLTDGIPFNPSAPVIIGMDFGRTPSAVITQEDIYGRVMVLEELVSDDMGLTRFIRDLLIPRLMAGYRNSRVVVVGDPSGVARSAYDESSAFSVLEDAGLTAVPAPTNDPARRIAAVEKLLLGSSENGKRRLLIDRRRCPKLATGFSSLYRYRRSRNGSLSPLPEKNEYSHVHDAMQYAALGHASGYAAGVILARNRRRQQRVEAPPARAWT